jgi:predicted nucleotidyltransferase
VTRDLLAERYAERRRAAAERAEALRRRIPALASSLVEWGARRVVLFGSLSSGAEPHAGTDVDLCVEGVSERDAARFALDLAGSAGCRVGIVCWESASPELRHMIETYGRDVTSPMTGESRHVSG